MEVIGREERDKNNDILAYYFGIKNNNEEIANCGIFFVNKNKKAFYEIYFCNEKYKDEVNKTIIKISKDYGFRDIKKNEF